MGERMTLKEYLEREEIKIQRQIVERRAWEATPEGKAEMERQRAETRANLAMEEAWAEANPRDPFAEGAEEALASGERKPPDEFDETEQELWLAGYDSEARDPEQDP
jgi:hypothetical protein